MTWNYLCRALRLAQEDYHDAKGAISDQEFTEHACKIVTAWCEWHIKGRKRR